MTALDSRHRRARALCVAGVAERGSATIFVVGFALVLFAGAGLAIDGGRAINARDKATDVAEQAARSGAGQLDQDLLRKDGTIRLNQGAARERADRFVTDAMAGSASSSSPRYTSTTSTATDSVTVRVSATYKTALLGIVGLNSIDVSGTATANPADANGVIP